MKKTKEEMQDYLNRMYNLARAYKLCKNQSEFAELLGVHRVSLSKALNGSPESLTENLIEKATAAVELHAGISCNNSGTITAGNIVSGEQKNFASDTPMEQLIDEMKAQREMYEQHTAHLLRIIDNLTTNKQ